MSNRHYLINSEDLQNLNAKLLSIAFSKDEGDWKSIMHTHHFTELLFVVSGEGSFSFNQEQSPLRRGDLVIIPPYTEHTERSSQNHPLEYYVLGIDGISFLSQKDRECAQVFCNFEHDPSIHELFRQMLYEIRTAQYGSQTICQHLLEILILKIIRSQQLIPVSINSIRMTKECARQEYLDSNYCRTHYAGHADRFDTYEQILYGALFYKICRTLPNSVSESDASEACTAFAEKYQLFDF